jgi:hypothetical protein
VGKYRLLALWQTGPFVLTKPLGPHRSRIGRASSALWTRVPWGHHGVGKVARQDPANHLLPRNGCYNAFCCFGMAEQSCGL